MAPPSAPPPSLFPPSTVQHIASTSLSLPPLPNTVASALAADTEHRLRLILQDAEKFMRHSRRNKLSCEDVKRALEVKGMEPVYGFLNTPYTRGGQPKLRKVVQPGGIVYQVEDEEIDIDAIATSLSSRHQPIPRKGGVGWRAHWLAVEGVQPLIPENPPPSELSAAPGALDETGYYDTAAASGLAAVGAASSTSGAVAPAPTAGSTSDASTAVGAGATTKDGLTVNAQAQPLVKHILSRELQVYYQRLTEAIMHGATPTTTASSSTDAVDAQGDAGMTASDAPATTSPLAEDPVSLAALSSLRADPGLHQLVPYLCQWISTTISAALSLPTTPATHNTTRRLVVDRMLGSIEAMLLNPHLGIEGYVHLLLPPLLSCILISLSSSYYDQSLRRRAAELLGKNILARFGGAYPSLKPRIARVLLAATFNGVDAAADTDSGKLNGQQAADEPVDDDQPPPTLGTKLGAILALRACGGGMTRALVRARRQQRPHSTLQGESEMDANGSTSSNDFGCKFNSLGRWVSKRASHRATPSAQPAPVKRSRRSTAASAEVQQNNTSVSDPEGTGPSQADLDADVDLIVAAVRECLHDLASMGGNEEGGGGGGGGGGEDAGKTETTNGEGASAANLSTDESLRTRVGPFWLDCFVADEEAKRGIRVGLAETLSQ